MSIVEEPGTGLQFVELSHPWGHHTPTFPGFADTVVFRTVTHAKHGVMTQRLRTVMHNSTHVNAPLHLIQWGDGVGRLPLDRFFGSGPVLGIEKAQWDLVTAADLDRVGDDVRAGDIVIVNTGWHRRYADSQEYFGRAPGLAKDAAQWLADRRVKMVGIDTATIDHPLATPLGAHRGGPLMKRLPGEFERETGRDPREAFAERNPAHRTLLAAGIPTIENVGGDVDAVTGRRCTFHACPWRWLEGDACIVRLVAIMDPGGRYRLAG